MKIERFEIAGLAQYSYILSSDGVAVVIDPIRDIDRYVEYVAKAGLTVAYVTETHIHADFASGSAALATATGAVLALSSYDEGQDYRYTMPHHALQDGDSLQFGNARLQVLHTPGHTPEHLSFVLFDLTRGAEEPAALFSGDFLFVGGLGRPDLLGERAKLSLARDLFRSLHQAIASLHDGVQVYPGHGSGSLCGAGISERSESTLGYERSRNPLLRLEEDAFVEEILGSVPPMPAYYPRMKSLNAAGAAMLTSVPGDQLISAEKLHEMLDANLLVLDLRRPEAFGGAHIRGAINIGAGQNLSLWAGWLVDPTKNIVIVSDRGDDEASRRALVRVGLDRIVGFLANGMPGWIDAGLPWERTVQLSTNEVEDRGLQSHVVDVRSDKEWQQGHIHGAEHIMLGDLAGKARDLPDWKSLIVVCGSGYRSSIGASLLQAHGISRVSSMNGGMSAWKRRKLPVVIPVGGKPREVVQT